MNFINFLLNLSQSVLAQCGSLGCVDAVNPAFRGVAGLGKLISAFLGVAIGLAGIMAVFQFISAGYMYLGSQGDPKKAEAAWWRIMYALIGLVVVGASFMAAGMIETITGVNPLKFKIQGPQ